jgi:hypothetical protein
MISWIVSRVSSSSAQKRSVAAGILRESSVFPRPTNAKTMEKMIVTPTLTTAAQMW